MAPSFSSPCACDELTHLRDGRPGYVSDTKRCILKVHGGPDKITPPSDAFYGGLASKAPPRPTPTNEWCRTVSWPFGGARLGLAPRSFCFVCMRGGAGGVLIDVCRRPSTTFLRLAVSHGAARVRVRVRGTHPLCVLVLKRFGPLRSAL